MPGSETTPGGEPDLVGDRERLLRIGMGAVFSACALFAATRLAVTLKTGLATPWWANGLGALAIALLWAWCRADLAARSTAAVHGTALVATLALVAPVPYGMGSTVWWLSLVGFAVVLLGRRAEARIWAVAIPVVVASAVLAEPFVQLRGAAGEPRVEKALAPFAFTLLLVAMAAGFRRVANQRAGELARANAARARFLAHVSHEIRTPLHGVLSMTDLALQGSLPKEAEKQVRTAHQSARVLLDLLNNILDVTRAESDALVVERAPFSLHAALGEVLRPLEAQARERGLLLAATAEEGLAERRIGDRFRVSQVALNLVGNALKFTSKGSIALRLRAVPGDAERVSLVVEDTGPGIEPALVAVLFEPFSQGSGARASGGSGLGLAIVRELALRMDGEVSVESEPGKGSRFTVTLRLPPEAGSPPGPVDVLLAGAPPPRPAPEPAGSPSRPLRVLVCEDEPVNQKVVRGMLRRLGHESTLVATAEEAWSAILSEDFDVLVTDIELPGMSGLELARRVRERERERGLRRLPVVAATAHVGADERTRVLAAGIDAHLTKPFGIRDVDAALAGSIPGRAP